MNLIEALKALEEGKKITNINWSDKEFVELDRANHCFIEENGNEFVFKIDRPVTYDDIWKIYREEPILNDEEKEYLSAVIKPFKNEVKYIKKSIGNLSGTFDLYYITIVLRTDEFINLPFFSKDSSMYKGMEENKIYTLKELGL